MKITIEDINQFEKRTKIINKVVAKKSNMPVLLTFLLSATEDNCMIRATDLETGCRINVSDLVTISDPGNICLPAKSFYALIKGKHGSLDIETSAPGSSHSALIGSMKMNGINPEEFPVWPNVEGIPSPVLNLATTLKKVSFAMGVSDTRYIINGLNLDCNEKKAVATDGHRLAVYDLNIDTTDLKDNIVIPSKAVKVLELLPENAKLSIDTRFALFSFENIEVMTRRLEGTFPKWQAVLPATADLTTTVNVFRAELISKIENTMKAIDKKVLSLYVRGDKLVIFGINPDRGELRETIQLLNFSQGDFQRFDFTGKYLIETLKSSTDETVSIKQPDKCTGPLMIDNTVMMPAKDDARPKDSLQYDVAPCDRLPEMASSDNLQAEIAA